MNGIELLNYLGLDLEGFFISVLALAIVIGIVFLIRTLRLDSLYKRYKDQLDIIERFAPEIIIRIAFPTDEVAYEKAITKYTEIAEAREASGKAWIDPRMLYAIDEVEKLMPEPYRIDLNVVIDKLETTYRDLKDAGAI